MNESCKNLFFLQSLTYTESVRISISFLSLEIPVFFPSTVISMNSRLLSTSAELDSLYWSKGCLQPGYIEPHPPHLLHHPAEKLHFMIFLISHLLFPQPLRKQQNLYRGDPATAEVALLLSITLVLRRWRCL